MGQTVNSNFVFIDASTAQTDINSFKRVLLPVIVALYYIRKYDDDKRKEKQPTKPGEESRLNLVRGITNLRKHVDAYNVYIQDDTETRLKCSSDKINKLKKDFLPTLDRHFNSDNPPQELPSLLNCFNRIANSVSAELYQTTARLLSEVVFQKADATAHLSRYIERINSFAYCQHLTGIMLPYFDPFSCVFIDTTGQKHPSMDAFLSSEQHLDRCEVTFDNKAPKPFGEYPKNPRKPSRSPDEKTTEPLTQTEPTFPRPHYTRTLLPADVKTPLDGSKYYIGHYLNADYKALMANVTLDWKKGELIGVRLEQHEDFFGKLGIGFRQVEGSIQQAVDDNPFFVLLRNDPAHTPRHVTTAIFQQLTIGQLANNLRWGTYATVAYPMIKIGHTYQREFMPVCGLMAFQPVAALPILSDLNEKLIAYTFSTGTLTTTDPDQSVCQTIVAIRYQLQYQASSMTMPVANERLLNHSQLLPHVGQYVCYYMRLMKNRFQTSHIEIMADGTATLRQKDDNNPILGFTTVDGELIWIHFSHNELTGREKIQFLLKPAQKQDPTVKLLGTFNSQTLQTSQVVSGRMLLVKREKPDTAWPDFIDEDPDDLTLANFNDIDNKHPDRVLRFFTQETTLGTLSDGPLWAEVARRLLEHPAIDLLDALCQKTNPYDINQFYYYTFKKETPNEQNFVIERDLVTFHPNGKVTIHAIRDNYTGYAYHYRKTLRLSLYNPSDGFLEVFFDLDHNATDLGNVQVLYGISVWHSPKRIQGKMVVLSRYGYQPGEFSPAIEQYRFTPGDEKACLEAEDKRTGGILSYLRGNHHRYLHTTTRSSAQAVRPRDQAYREINFLIACYYGMLIKNKETDHARRKQAQLLKICRHHVRESYVHGYGCDFAGLKLPIDFSKDIQDEALSQPLAEACYASHFLDSTLEPALRDQHLNQEPVMAIIARIREIAGEQRYFVWAFSPGGPLDRHDLREYARPFWPDLMKEVDKQTKPPHDERPDYAA